MNSSPWVRRQAPLLPGNLAGHALFRKVPIVTIKKPRWGCSLHEKDLPQSPTQACHSAALADGVLSAHSSTGPLRSCQVRVLSLNPEDNFNYKWQGTYELPGEQHGTI